MIALAEVRTLPIAERLQLLESIWDSIEEEQDSLPDHPAVIDELRARKARFMANPASGILWQQAKAQIRSGRA